MLKTLTDSSGDPVLTPRGEREIELEKLIEIFSVTLQRLVVTTVRQGDRFMVIISGEKEPILPRSQTAFLCFIVIFRHSLIKTCTGGTAGD